MLLSFIDKNRFKASDKTKRTIEMPMAAADAFFLERDVLLITYFRLHWKSGVLASAGAPLVEDLILS